jgi:hypothetical protein
MSTRSRWGLVRKADNITAICEPIVWIMWEPQYLTTICASMTWYGDSFTFISIYRRRLTLLAIQQCIATIPPAGKTRTTEWIAQIAEDNTFLRGLETCIKKHIHWSNVTLHKSFCQLELDVGKNQEIRSSQFLMLPVVNRKVIRPLSISSDTEETCRLR